MIRYNIFCTARYSEISMELREVTIQMYRKITVLLLEDNWTSREICSDWIAKWENILYCIQTNDFICNVDYEEFANYALNRIMEICDIFMCPDLYEKYLVN